VNKQALSLAIFIAGAYPAASSALGLGDIESNSHLNQPLRAKIDLLSAAPADASQIQVRLAPPDVFNRVGVARPDFLGSLRFTPTVQGGKPVILVSSDAPIQEPFVNFLLEVSWPKGQLLKEYTVMLDPPVLMQPGNTVAGEAAVRAEPKAAGNVRRPARQAAAQQAAPSAQQQQAPAANRNRTYRVKSGDTLFRVASRLQRPGVSNDQMMMALFRANPGAFIGNNINNLRNNAVMKAPSANDVGNASRAEARRQIRQQNADWREFRKSLAGNTVPQQALASQNTNKQNTPAATKQNTPAPNAQDKARLEVLGANKDSNGVAKDAAVAAGNAKLAEIEKQLALASESLAARQKENGELKSRVTDLESMMSKKNRLLALRDTQLAEIQKQLADNGIKVAPTADALDAAAGTDPQGSQAVAVTPDQGTDIQTHMANVAGQEQNTILRTDPQAQPAQPATPTPTPAPPINNAAVEPPAAATPLVGGNRPTPAGMATGTANNIPLRPAIVPVTPAATPPKKPAVFADQNGGDTDLLGLLTSPLALKIGAGSLALLLLLWLLGRRRKPDGGANALRREANLGDDFDATAPVDTHDNFDVNSLEKELEKADSRGVKDDPFGIGASPAASGNTGWDTLDDVPPIGGSAPTNSNAPVEDDCLTEANVYIAYGLYQQAESELKKCIERNPDKPEYRHKLLECYFVANNREAFDNHAQQFAAMSGASKDSLWKSVVEWGRKISPDNKLYYGDASAASNYAAPSVAATVATALGGMAAATAGITLAKDAAYDTHDKDEFAAIDTLSTPLKALTPMAAPTSAPPAAPMTLDFPEDDFGDLDLGELDFDDIDLDKLLHDSETTDDVPNVGLNALAAPVAAPAAAKPELPDFDFDAPAPASKAVPAPVDDDAPFDFDLDDLDDALDLDFDLDDGDVAVKPVQAVAAPSVPQPEMATEHLLDFDLDDLDDLPDSDDAKFDLPTVAAPVAAVTAGAAASSATNLNLHLDNDNGLNRILPKDTFYAPISDEDKDWLGDIDDALSFLDFPDEEIDLHEAHISTKLDLARAYLDMGDIEGARSTLEEVMVEGNDDQRREAEVLLHQTG
jgi:pilus assembly protein FimV